MTLTGFLLLIPQELAFLRLLAALLTCILYLVILMHARPHREPSTAAVAQGINVTLLCLFLTALLIKVENTATPQARLALFGSDNVFWLTVLLLVFNFGALVGTAALLTQQVKSAGQMARRVRLRDANGEVQLPTLAPGQEYHLFLSHGMSPCSVLLPSRCCPCPSLLRSLPVSYTATLCAATLCAAIAVHHLATHPPHTQPSQCGAQAKTRCA